VRCRDGAVTRPVIFAPLKLPSSSKRQLSSDHRAKMSSDSNADLSLNRVKNMMAGFAAERDWDQYHTPRNLVLALTGEVGELAEIFQWRGEVPVGLPGWSEEEKKHVGEELSDILLYLVRLAERCNINLAEAVTHKFKQNALKYPVDKVKGKHEKYTAYSSTLPARAAQATAPTAISSAPSPAPLSPVAATSKSAAVVTAAAGPTATPSTSASPQAVSRSSSASSLVSPALVAAHAAAAQDANSAISPHALSPRVKTHNRASPSTDSSNSDTPGLQRVFSFSSLPLTQLASAGIVVRGVSMAGNSPANSAQEPSRNIASPKPS